MRINQNIKKPETKAGQLLGDFNGVKIYLAADDVESIVLSKGTFDIFSGIVDGFLDMGKDKIPDMTEDVNSLLKGRDTEIRYKGTTVLGFYIYMIVYGEKNVEFAIEPDLLPVFLYCVRDMARRHKLTPHKSYVSTDVNELKSPLTPINRAIMDMAEMKSEIMGDNGDQV